MPPMIDTHCHLDVPAFADDVDAVIARATAAGVVGMLVPSIRPATWGSCAALVERHRAAGLRLAIGVHPQIVPELAPDEIGAIDVRRGDIGGKRAHDGHRGDFGSERVGDGRRAVGARPDGYTTELKHQATNEERDHTPLAIDDADPIDMIAKWIAREAVAYRAIAIGECGLDGATGDIARQEMLFRAHIRAARVANLPLVIHVLRAHDLAPRILREELQRPLPAAHIRGPVGVLHSYSGGAELVDVYRELGMAFSFAGPVSYANARKPVEAARVIPPELLLAETDAPDQAPEGHRGGRSEPAFVSAVIAGLATARGQTAEEVAALTTANAKRVFGSWGSVE